MSAQHHIIHGDLDSLTQPATAVEDEFAQNLTVHHEEHPFLESLSVLRTALRHNPTLVETVSHIARTSECVEVRLFTDWDETALELWALLLTDVSTSAERRGDSVFGEVTGLLDSVKVRIIGLIPADAVSEAEGVHEWALGVSS